MMDIRGDFPILAREIEDERLIYLDSAATALKPNVVVQAVTDFYTRHTANVHRAVHVLGHEATDLFESGRERIARFVGADASELIFTSGATMALNILRRALSPDLRCITTVTEHHSNFVPWAYAENSRVIGLDNNGALDLEALENALKQGADLLALGYVSNVHGVVNPVNEIIEMAHRHGAMVVLDAAQAVGHFAVDVKALDVDFAVFSAHKMMGPGGVGGLYVKRELLSKMRPVFLGGHMVDQVHLDEFSVQEAPACFEAGTPPIEGVIGWGAAVDYLNQLGVDKIEHHCKQLVEHAETRLAQIDKLRLIANGDSQARSATVSFLIDGVESHGVARLLSNRANICVRSGFHCAQPLHETLGVGPTVRASVHAYNVLEDIDTLADTLNAVTQFV